VCHNCHPKKPSCIILVNDFTCASLAVAENQKMLWFAALLQCQAGWFLHPHKSQFDHVLHNATLQIRPSRFTVMWSFATWNHMSGFKTNHKTFGFNQLHQKMDTIHLTIVAQHQPVIGSGPQDCVSAVPSNCIFENLTHLTFFSCQVSQTMKMDASNILNHRFVMEVDIVINNSS